MVDFWTNHFNIFARKGLAAYRKPQDERNVVRANVLGSFPKMLEASAKSTAMLLYLDQQASNFSQPNETFSEALVHIATYYAFKVTLIFDRLCEAIALLAAVFTIAWMQRNNELLPLLSAGVSTRRVVMPVLVAAIATLGLSAVNQELLLPNVDSFFVEHRSDSEGVKVTAVKGAFDRNGNGEPSIRRFGASHALMRGLSNGGFIDEVSEQGRVVLRIVDHRAVPGDHRQAGGRRGGDLTELFA